MEKKQPVKNSKTNGTKPASSKPVVKKQMVVDPNYNIEEDEELWMKLQFIECLRDGNYEEADEHLQDLLELYPDNNGFMKEFQKLLPAEIKEQHRKEALEEAEGEEEEEESEEEKEEAEGEDAEEEESEEEEEEGANSIAEIDRTVLPDDKPPKRSYFFVSTR